jgi:hypothetical protein
VRLWGIRVAGLAAALSALSTGASGAAPTPVTLVQYGANRGSETTGTFTAESPLLCPVGSWRDSLVGRSGNNVAVERLHECADGSGTVTFYYAGISEHLAGAGSWHVLVGTGRYALLRGRGTTSTVVTSYDPVLREGTFTNTWRGVLDFDPTPPNGRFDRVRLTRVGRSRAYRLRTALVVRDDVAENRIQYELEVYVPRRGLLARRSGVRAPGRLPLDVTIRPARGSKRIVLEAYVRDPVGNGRRLAAGARLPR